VLRNSLAINPRRTSSWVPMADVLFEIGDSNSAMAALLLAYEFSENKEKTKTFFDGKAGSSDRIASLYAQALEKINQPRQSTQTSMVESAAIGQKGGLTKSEARSYLIKRGKADPNRLGPEEEAMIGCLIDPALDDAYKNTVTQELGAIESRMKGFMDDPKNQMQMMRCIINSPAMEKALTEKNADKRPTPPASSAPPLDMDDLRLDMASLDGKKIRVRGVGHYVMDMFMLKKSMTDMSPIIVDITKLPRDQRREIMNQCSDLMSGCRVTVHGTVGKVRYQKELVAERVEW
jgi:hypothetical protein